MALCKNWKTAAPCGCSSPMSAPMAFSVPPDTITAPKRMKRTVALDHLLGEPKTVIQQLFELVRVNGDRGGLDDWRVLYRLARTDERLRGRIHRMIQTIPTPLPHFWLAALASLGEQIDWN